jgi:hypothetical protein
MAYSPYFIHHAPNEFFRHAPKAFFYSTPKVKESKEHLFNVSVPKAVGEIGKTKKRKALPVRV